MVLFTACFPTTFALHCIQIMLFWFCRAFFRYGVSLYTFSFIFVCGLYVGFIGTIFVGSIFASVFLRGMFICNCKNNDRVGRGDFGVELHGQNSGFLKIFLKKEKK